MPSNPYYVPFFAHAVVWLYKRHKDDLSLPRPEIWLLDHFRATALDSDEATKRKAEAYARTLSIIPPAEYQPDPSLVDWPFGDEIDNDIFDTTILAFVTFSYARKHCFVVVSKVTHCL